MFPEASSPSLTGHILHWGEWKPLKPLLKVLSCDDRSQTPQSLSRAGSEEPCVYINHQYNTKVPKKAQTLNLQENALGKKIAGKPGYPCKPVLSDHGITPLHWSASWTCWISICWVLKCLRSKITLLGQHWSVSVGVVWIGLSSLDYSNVLHTKKNMVHWKVLWRSQSCSAKTSVLKGIVQQKIWRAKFIAWSRKRLLCSKKESKSYRF